MRLTIYTDGACKGNPGPASIGVVILDESGNTIKEISKAIGLSTNNKAEYLAVIEGLSTALDLHADEIELMMDSELVVKQLTGKYRVKNTDLKVLHSSTINLLLKFNRRSIKHIDRSFNSRADSLANKAMGY
jgi:ribonuclease HI